MRCYHNRNPIECDLCARPDRARAISAVMRLLRRRPCTASDVARLLNVSRVTAYKWIGYARRAAQVQTRTEEYGERGRGPRALVYFLRTERQNGTRSATKHNACCNPGS